MKRITLKWLFFILGIVIFVSCENIGKKEVQNLKPDSHTSEIALDWQGQYWGRLPCADCDGIDTELTLNSDLTFVLIEKRAKNDTLLIDTLAGKFIWDGSQIRLQNIPTNTRPTSFKVEENQLRQLDMNGNKISGELERKYILTKLGNPRVENKKWQIIELNGKTVNDTEGTHFLFFHPEEKRLEAKAGCNVILMNYRITHTFKMEISQGISTLMACPGNNLESELIETLSKVDNLSLGIDTLTLNKGKMAPLIRLIPSK